MPKNPKIVAACDALVRQFNPGTSGFNMSLAIGVCVTCNENAYEFKDALSKREYEISGMCQVCQDKTFGPPVEEPLSPADAIRLIGGEDDLPF